MIYKVSSVKKSLLVLSLLASFFVLFGGNQSASAQFADEKIDQAFPRGQSLYDAWIMLSQYECPGHCLQTPKADLRIFYTENSLDDAGLNSNNALLSVRVQTLCRYVGNPNGSSNMSRGTNPNGSPDWPASISCNAFNDVINQTSLFRIKRGDLIQDIPKYGANVWFTNLSLNLSRNPGSDQPLVGVYVYSDDGAGWITAEEDLRPTTSYPETNCYTGAGGSCSPSGGPRDGNNNVISFWNNYGRNGSDTTNRWGMTFAPDCSVGSNTQVHLRWYDADDSPGGNGTQTAGLSFDLIEIDPGGNNSFVRSGGNPINNWQNDLGGDDSYRQLRFTVKPGHKYVWRWNNVSATNGIQVWLPYSEMNARIDCGTPQCGDPGQPACPVTGSMCNVQSVANPNPYVGGSTTITVSFTNTSNTYDWWLGTDANPPPAGYTRASPNPGNWIYAYRNSEASTATTLNKRHLGVLLDNGSGAGGQIHVLNETGRIRLRQGQSADRTFTIYNNNPAALTRTYSFNVWNAESGNQTPVQCSRAVTWRPPNFSATCQEIRVTNPGNIPFYLVFSDRSSGAVVHNSGNMSPFGGPSNGSPVWNTFATFTNLYPHNAYKVDMVHWGTNSVMATRNINSPLASGQCMQAACTGSLAGNIVEPGETTPVNYGVKITNYTGRTFVGLYNALASAGGGLSIVGGANPDTDPPFAANTDTDLDGPWTLQANYTGTLSIALRFNSTPILGAVCTDSYTPQTRPYINVNQGDISSGGAFAAATGPGKELCSLASLTGPSDGNNSIGGIRTFAIPSTGAGSSADFAAFALGLIHGSTAGRYGFGSDSVSPGDGAPINSGPQAFNFANMNASPQPGDYTPGEYLGGLLGGPAPANSTDLIAHCATNYYSQVSKVLNPTFDSPGDINLTGMTTAQRFFNGPVTIHGTVNAGQSITIFVNGSVRITNPGITYGNWQFFPDHTNNSPYLTVIALGDIDVESSVNRIDGFYVAQPGGPPGTSGAFSTCSIGGVKANAAQAGSCLGQLTINGSVLAQHVYSLRANGTVVPTLSGGVLGIPAEIFNFSPTAVIGRPNFVSDNAIESLYTLPPVF